MGKDQDTQRIILSRTTLARYQRMAAEGVFPAGDAGLIAAEVAVLRKMAADYPNKAETLADLIEKWEGLLPKKVH